MNIADIAWQLNFYVITLLITVVGILLRRAIGNIDARFKVIENQLVTGMQKFDTSLEKMANSLQAIEKDTQNLYKKNMLLEQEVRIRLELIEGKILRLEANPACSVNRPQKQIDCE
jgi:hypothetical protein